MPRRHPRIPFSNLPHWHRNLNLSFALVCHASGQPRTLRSGWRARLIDMRTSLGGPTIPRQPLWALTLRHNSCGSRCAPRMRGAGKGGGGGFPLTPNPCAADLDNCLGHELLERFQPPLHFPERQLQIPQLGKGQFRGAAPGVEVQLRNIVHSPREAPEVPAQPPPEQQRHQQGDQRPAAEHAVRLHLPLAHVGTHRLQRGLCGTQYGVEGLEEDDGELQLLAGVGR